MISGGRARYSVLFLIFISDVNKDIHHSSISSSADDTRVLKQINSIKDCNLLQKDLYKIYEWSIANNMCFNSCKFERIRYTFSNSPVINYAYLANDESEIIEKEHLRDLEVNMSKNAAFQDHKSNISRASRMKLGWILCTF